MFNWFVGIFTLVSAAILFVTWSRAVSFRAFVHTPQQESDWRNFRMLILVSLILHVILFIIAVIGLERTYAWLAAIFLIVFQLTYFLGVSFLQGIAPSTSKSDEVPPPESE